ncbi:transposable element tc3 transposase [Trichonephila clavipes]|nr:transposable element tc3 transposase [Trichonephila clavipes]
MRKGPLTAINLQLMVTKFEETGSLNVCSGRGRKPVSTEAIEKVALQVEEDKASNVQASTSVRLVAEALDLPRSTVQKIMRNILRYYPYKLQLVQELLPHHFETRHLFALQFLARLEVDPEWPWNILWTDEAHFHLDGSVNTHNCRIWESDNPHSTLQIPLHSPKDVLKHHFTEGRVISRPFRHLWPPRSPDLNPWDFWLWGHLRQLVSCDQPRTLPDLKDSISRHVLNMSQNTLRSTGEHAILRFQIVAENDGPHVEPLLL